MTAKEFHSIGDVHPDDVLTPIIAASLIHRKAGFIRERIRKGEIVARDRGGWLIKGKDFLAWLERDDERQTSTGSENLRVEAPAIREASGASTSPKRAAAQMASLSRRRGIGSR
jgi:hypothetical protein